MNLENRLFYRAATTDEILQLRNRIKDYGFRRYTDALELRGKTDYQQMWNRTNINAAAKMQIQDVILHHLFLDILEGEGSLKIFIQTTLRDRSVKSKKKLVDKNETK